MSERWQGNDEDASSFRVLDDGVVVRIMQMLDPYPDLMNLQRTCKRFHRLASDERLRIEVYPSQAASTSASHEREREREREEEEEEEEEEESEGVSQHFRLRRKRYRSLDAALSRSRAGDRIFLLPGVHLCRDVKVSVKVQLIGMGTSSKDVKLAACLGLRTQHSHHSHKRKRNHRKWERKMCAERAILEFQASSHLSHLTIFATLGPCVLHKSGNLTIDKCSLICSFHPLEHLNIPIVTYASTATEGARTSGESRGEKTEISMERGGVMEAGHMKKGCFDHQGGRKNHHQSTSIRPEEEEEESFGKLQVKETRIEGGKKAVEVNSRNNVLRDVRTCFLASGKVFWFRVTSGESKAAGKR